MAEINRRDFIRLFVGAAAVSLIPSKARASEAQHSSSLVEFTDDLAARISEKMAELLSGESSIKASGVTKCYGPDRKVNGCITLLESYGAPYGYVCLDVNKPGLLSSCSLGQGVTHPVYEAQPTPRTLSSNESSHVLMLSPIDFCIYDDTSRCFYFENGSTYSIGDSIVTLSDKPDSWSDVMIDVSEISSNYNISGANYIGQFDAVRRDDILAQTDHYACVVTALSIVSSKMDIASFYLEPEMYMEIWHSTNTRPLPDDEQHREGKILGSTRTEYIVPGFQAYALQRGHSIIGTAQSSPSYNTFKQCVDSQRNSVLSAGFFGESSHGHAMCVQGYATLSNGSTSFNALAVADGWDASVVYLRYTPSDYRYSHAAMFYET